MSSVEIICMPSEQLIGSWVVSAILTMLIFAFVLWVDDILENKRKRKKQQIETEEIVKWLLTEFKKSRKRKR